MDGDVDVAGHHGLTQSNMRSIMVAMSSTPASAQAPGYDPRAEVVRRLRAEVVAPMLAGSAPVAERLVPVHPVLAGLLPGGGLRPGAAYAVGSSGLLLLTLLAGASRSGEWCAAVGMPGIGAEAAEEAGVELSRLVLVPRPGDRWLAATAAVAEVMPIVAVRPGGRVRDGDAARLAARLRDRGTVLIVAGAWPQVEATLTLSGSQWSGVEDGHGYLDHREAVVTVTSKRVQVPRSARILLPDPQGGLGMAPGGFGTAPGGGLGVATPDGGLGVVEPDGATRSGDAAGLRAVG